MTNNIIQFKNNSLDCYSKSEEDFLDFLKEDIKGNIEWINNFFKNINIDIKIQKWLEEKNHELIIGLINKEIYGTEKIFYITEILKKIDNIKESDILNVKLAIICHSNPSQELWKYEEEGNEKKLFWPNRYNISWGHNWSFTKFENISEDFIVLHYITEKWAKDTDFMKDKDSKDINLFWKIVAISLIDNVNKNYKEENKSDNYRTKCDLKNTKWLKDDIINWKWFITLWNYSNIWFYETITTNSPYNSKREKKDFDKSKEKLLWQLKKYLKNVITENYM